MSRSIPEDARCVRCGGPFWTVPEGASYQSAAPCLCEPVIPAISLWQPWASLLFASPRLKVHETRGFALAPHRWGTRVAIHAALKVVPRWEIEHLIPMMTEAWGDDWMKQLHFGAIIGTVRMVESYPARAERSDSMSDLLAGHWSPDRFAWRTEDPILLDKPLPTKGRQSWFSVDLEDAVGRAS